MNIDHAAEIRWDQGMDDVRCRVPRRSHGLATTPGWLMILAGGFIASWPLLGILFFGVMGATEDPDMFAFAVFGPLVCFGPFCFTSGGFFLLRGLFLVAGRDEIVIRRGRLTAMSRWGPFRSRRRCSLEDLVGFRVESHLAGAYSETAGMQGLASLVAERLSGSPVHLLRGYPKPLIDELVVGLNQHCGRFAAREGIPWRESLQTDEVSLNPEKIDERPAQPRNSKATLEQWPDGLLIELPHRGWWRPGSRFVTIWCFGWNGMTLLSTAAFVPALLAGKVEGEPWVAWILMPIFWIVGIVAFVVLFRKARRSGRIVLAGKSLSFEETDPFGSTTLQWNTEEIECITVGAKKYETEDSITWKNFITVCPTEKERQWFNNREKPELEWLATVLRQALGLGSQATLASD